MLVYALGGWGAVAWLPRAVPEMLVTRPPLRTCTMALLIWNSLNKKMSFVQLLNFSTLCLAALRTSGLFVFIVWGNPGFAPELLRSWEQKSESNKEPDKNIGTSEILGPGVRPYAQ